MGKRSPIRVVLTETPGLLRFSAWCAHEEDHYRMVDDLLYGLSPMAEVDELVRALPDPEKWVCERSGFYRAFPCGCVIDVLF